MSFSEEQENEALGIRNNDKEPEKSSSENNIVEEIEGKEFPQPISNADHFLVCVFNVSSKVSYSILQVAKTSTVKELIVQALAKNRKDSEGERKSPEEYVLVEEIDVPESSRKANKPCSKLKRIIDPSENVYLIQLSWKAAGRFILEEKDKLANEHGLLTETYSEPVQPGTGLSPSLRRHSRMIASSVRRISRSFYSASNETLNTSHHRTGSFAEISGVTRQSVVARKIAQQRFNQTSQSDSDLPELEKKVVEPIVTTPPSSSPSTSSCQEPSQTPVSKKLSKINLRKLKIW